MPEIVNLRDRPEYLEKLAHWHQQEWSHLNPGESLAQRILRMQNYLSDHLIPSMFIALDGEKLLGSAAIVQHDMDSHTELSPWLASVFVDPECRRQGIGTALVKHALQQADKDDVEQLFLFTPDQAHFYHQLGWIEYSREEYHGEQVTLMTIVFR